MYSMCWAVLSILSGNGISVREDANRIYIYIKDKLLDCLLSITNEETYSYCQSRITLILLPIILYCSLNIHPFLVCMYCIIPSFILVSYICSGSHIILHAITFLLHTIFFQQNSLLCICCCMHTTHYTHCQWVVILIDSIPSILERCTLYFLVVNSNTNNY
jgi:hypothetical protein